ncbi:hypothetical protein DPMN_127844 [Dreissena polymorpha]|uniref:Uncharacterized protein n=1 Tax=Dreissena polymorpha TaxID=45954 RepID=A0A9D4GZZ9_DREPO|nr:hypothetical protein DPMN_127844 [Dreissena polymorpha]
MYLVKRGADVASDHHLLVAPLKLKLKKSWTGGAQPTPTVQHCHSERHLEARRVQGHSLQQVPGPRGTA